MSQPKVITSIVTTSIIAELIEQLKPSREVAESIDISPCTVNLPHNGQHLAVMVDGFEGCGYGAAIYIRYKDLSAQCLVIPAVSPDRVPQIAERMGIPLF